MDQELADRLAIRDLIDDWVVYSDAGDSERFQRLWHEDGHMMATWTQSPAAQFVASRRKVFEGGATQILHFQGGHSAQIVGERAVAQTKMQILQRADVEGVPCDVICTGRFYDFLEKRAGRWGMVHRQPIYEKDRLDSLVPGLAPVLDKTLLQSFPEGYRHLAYLQSRLGYPVKTDMPGLRGPATDALYAKGRAWLEGRSGHPKDW